MQSAVLPVVLFIGALLGLALALLLVGVVFSPRRVSRVKRMPYESGMDPIHDTHRRFDVRFHLLAIAFLVFDVELLFLYPWAVALRTTEPAAAPVPTAVAQAAAEPLPAASAKAVPVEPVRPVPEFRVRPIFVGGMVFLAVLTLGFLYDWRKGVFQWR